MPYFRVGYDDDYIEGEYETEYEAIEDFVESLENVDMENQVSVEKYNEDTERWE